MRTRTRLATAVLVGVTLGAPASMLADAQKHEWFGSWSMNHDGHTGALTIADIKADCAAPVWCDMRISYVDREGATHRGRIENLADRLQHMRFVIEFPNNSQLFDAYIFSWDKGAMAGTTYWGGRTFGFYATKQSSGGSRAGADLVVIATEGQGPTGYCQRFQSQFTVTVKNQGTVEAPPSQIRLDFFPGGSATSELFGPGQNGALPPGVTWDIQFLNVPPSACFDPDCEFRITLDEGSRVAESNEDNNVVAGACNR